MINYQFLTVTIESWAVFRAQEEFTVALRSLLSGLRLFYTDAVMPGDAELEVAIDQCFARPWVGGLGPGLLEGWMV